MLQNDHSLLLGSTSEESGNGLRGVLVWTKMGTPIVNTWLRPDGAANVLTSSASDQTLRQLVEATLAILHQETAEALAATGQEIEKCEGDSVSLRLSIARLGNVVAALRGLQSIDPASSKNTPPKGSVESHQPLEAKMALPATLNLRIPMTIVHKSTSSKVKTEEGEQHHQEEEGDAAHSSSIDLMKEITHSVPVTAAIVYGVQMTVCVFDLYNPEMSKEERVSHGVDGVVEGSCSKRLCDARSLMALLTYRGITASDSGKKTFLALAAQKALKQTQTQEETDRKEENFDSRAVLSDADGVDATSDFVQHPRTHPALRDAGITSFIQKVQIFVSELVREQRQTDGLFFLQRRSAVLQGLPLSALSSSSAVFGMPHPQSLTSQNSGWFATAGVQRKHGAFCVAGSAISPLASTTLEAAALEAVLLSVGHKERVVHSDDSSDQHQSRVTRLVDATGEEHFAAWLPVWKQGLAGSTSLLSSPTGVAPDGSPSMDSNPSDHTAAASDDAWSMFLILALPVFELSEDSNPEDRLPFVQVSDLDTAFDDGSPASMRGRERRLVVNSLASMLRDM